MVIKNRDHRACISSFFCIAFLAAPYLWICLRSLRVENQQKLNPNRSAGSGNRTRATLVGGECCHHCSIPAPHTPYSKMAAILVFFCFHANWPLWPRSRLNILLNFTFESEAIRANLHENKRILKWRPYWNKVYNASILKR